MRHPNIFKAALTLGTLAELDVETLPFDTEHNILAWANTLVETFPDLTAMEIPEFVWFLGESYAGVAELTAQYPHGIDKDLLADFRR